MKRFFLSQNTNFSFELFGFQHIMMILFTLLLVVIIFLLRKKLWNFSVKQQSHIRIIIAIIILLNMFLYRGSYIYYGVYDVKFHLSLYYCHIINYLFVLSLIINHKFFYKNIYVLSWIGAVWAIIFPDLSGGIDCFIFYSSFISHNLLLVFVTLIITINKIQYSFLDCFKCVIYAIIIVLFTYVVNYDFGTKFNTPDSILKNFLDNCFLLMNYHKYIILILLGLFGAIMGFIVSKAISKED